MGEKLSHSGRVSTKIMKQSKQVLNKLPRRRKGDILYHANWHWFTCTCAAPCSNNCKCSDTNRMSCKRSWIAFPVVWVLFLPFHPQPLYWERLCFVLCVYQAETVNSNVPTTVMLFLSCIEITCSSSNCVFSSIKQARIDGSVVRTDYKLVPF